MSERVQLLFRFTIEGMDEVALAVRLYHWTAKLSRLELDPIWAADPMGEFRMAQEVFSALVTQMRHIGFVSPAIVDVDTDMVGFAMEAFRWLWQVMPYLEASQAPSRLMLIADHVGRH